MERVIPFFRRNPLLSAKGETFERFAIIVTQMEAGEHHSRSGFERLVRLAFEMNGGGRYRKWALGEVIGNQNPQRLYAEHSGDPGVKIQSELHGDMQSQAEMT
jgi:hypothetical protein